MNSAGDCGAGTVIGTTGGMDFPIMSIPSYDAIEVQSENRGAGQSPHPSGDLFSSLVVASKQNVDAILMKQESGVSVGQAASHGGPFIEDEASDVEHEGATGEVRSEVLIEKIVSSFTSVFFSQTQRQANASDFDGGHKPVPGGPTIVNAPEAASGKESTRAEEIFESALLNVMKNQEEGRTAKPGDDKEAEQGKAPGLSVSTAAATDLQDVPSAVAAHVQVTTGEAQGPTAGGDNTLASVITVLSHAETTPLSPTTPLKSEPYNGEAEHKARHVQLLPDSHVTATDMDNASGKSADRGFGLQGSRPLFSVSSPVSDQGDGGELAALVIDRDTTVSRTEPNTVIAHEAAFGDEITMAEKSVDTGVPRVVRKPNESDVVAPEHSRNAEKGESPSSHSGVAISEIPVPASSTTEGPRVNHPAAPSAVVEPLRSMAESPSDVTVVRRSDTSLEVRMTVEGIGEVNVEVVLDNGAITGRVSTSDVIGKELIERNLPQLLDALSREGLNIGGFSVSLRNGRNTTGAGPYEREATAQVQAGPVVTTRRGSGHTISLFV